MLSFSKILGCFAAVSVATVVACSAPQRDAITDTAALTGNSNEGACDALRVWNLVTEAGEGVAATSKDNFATYTQVTPDPAATKFFAFGTGDGVTSIWVEMTDTTATFFVRTSTTPATLLMKADLSAGAAAKPTYTDANGQAVACIDTRTAPPAPSCLNTDPIDATQYPYTKTHPAMPGSCTAADLATFSQYYKDHAADNDLLTGWKNSVPATCSACIFSNDTNAAWAPMIAGTDRQGGATFSVNQGGCIEEVSHNEACGRSYNQYQECLLDACLKDCHTQAEFTKCRQDQAVLTTSCKDAYTAVQSNCGAHELGSYLTKCKGTSYTFEGPIKVLCIGTP